MWNSNCGNDEIGCCLEMSLDHDDIQQNTHRQKQHVLIEEVSRKLSCTAKTVGDISTKLARSILNSVKENNTHCGNDQLHGKKGYGSGIPCVVLMIKDGFLLALAEITCVRLWIPFVPLNPDHPAQFIRSQREVLCEQSILSTIDEDFVESVVKEYYDEVETGKHPTQASSMSFREEFHCHQQTDELNEVVVGTRPATTCTSLTAPLLHILCKIQERYKIHHMIFTSGSTGAPKCVVATRHNVFQYLEAVRAFFSLKDGSRVLLASAATFDPSIGDIFICACSGGSKDPSSSSSFTGRGRCTLITANRADIEQNLGHVIRCGAPDFIIATPVLWTQLDDELLLEGSSGDERGNNPFSVEMCVALGGEAMSARQKAVWASRVRLYNIYGVTEATIYQSAARVFPQVVTADRKRDSGADCPSPRRGMMGDEGIGKPLSGSITMDVDSCFSSESLAEGAQQENQGELILGGETISLGYLQELQGELRRQCLLQPDGGDDDGSSGLAELEESRFRQVDTSSAFFTDANSGSRCYRTGDIVRVSGEQGDLQERKILLCGRTDFQVKINGKRTSLEEVAQQITHALEGVVTSCVCIAASPTELVSEASRNVNNDELGGINSATKILAVIKLCQEEEEKHLRLEDVSLDLITKVIRLVCEARLPRHIVPLHSFFVSPGFQGSGNVTGPAGLVIASEFPLKASGKVDYQSLSTLVCTTLKQMLSDERLLVSSSVRPDDDASAPCVDVLWKTVRNLWEEIFGVPVRDTTDFFRIGGDSLTSLKMCRLLYLKTVGASADAIDNQGTMPSTFRAQNLFEYPTLHTYVEFLRSEDVNIAASTADSAIEGDGGSANPPEYESSSTVGLLGHRSAVDTTIPEEIAVLFEAVESRCVTLVELLLANRVCPVDGVSKRSAPSTSPLHIAAAAGDVSIAEVLLKYGAKPTIFNADGVTPCHLGAAVSVEIVKLMFRHGFPINVRDRRLQTLLHCSARTGNATVTHWLLQNTELSWDDRDCWQRSAVHWAVLNNHISVIRVLRAFYDEHGTTELVRCRKAEKARKKSGEAARRWYAKLAKTRTHLPYLSPHEQAMSTYGEASEMALLTSAFSE